MWDKYMKVRKAILPYLIIVTVLVALGMAEYFFGLGPDRISGW